MLTLNSQQLHILNIAISIERARSAEKNILEIHIGNIHPVFEELFCKSKRIRRAIYLTDINGIPVAINWRCDDESYPKVHPVKDIKDVPQDHTTKTWLKTHGQLKSYKLVTLKDWEV